jgi:imidazolonepropionase-like amidohydrolase
MEDFGKYSLVNATVLTRYGEEAISPGYVTIDGNKITAVGAMRDYAKVDGFAELDLSGQYVMPGLIDVHVHLVGGRGELSSGVLGVMAENKTVRAMRSVYEAQKMLRRGITSLRDISIHGTYLKRIFGQGLTAGPRVIACGPGLTRTGGHADLYQFTEAYVREQGFWAVLADGPDEVRRAVRRNLREGADQIKLWMTGGGFFEHDRYSDIHYTMEELKTCVDEAHMIEGTLVCAHAEINKSIRMCIEAGVDTIEHGEDIDEETALLMRERGTILVPTLNLVANWYRDFVAGGDAPANVRPDAFLYRTRDDEFSDADAEVERNAVLASFQVARANGVKIAMGSDTLFEPLTDFGEYSLREFAFLVENGMSVNEAIQSATEISAQALGMGHRLGVLEAGYLADILVVKKDPTESSDVLYDAGNIHYVISDGRIAVEDGRLTF